jgi:hypothetical protein
MFRLEWFAKFFSKEVVRSLGKLRGKPRRRFRDRLLTVLLAGGLHRLRGLPFGRNVGMASIRSELRSFAKSFSALSAALACWLRPIRESRERRLGHRQSAALRALRSTCADAKRLFRRLTRSRAWWIDKLRNRSTVASGPSAIFGQWSTEGLPADDPCAVTTGADAGASFDGNIAGEGWGKGVRNRFD